MGAIEQKPLVVVLAAGRASRFGGGKLDADCAGKPVGQWVLDAVAQAGLPAGVIVVGEDCPGFAKGSGWDLLVNDNAGEGLGTSLALAASHALAQERGLLVLLGDMPLVTGLHIAALANADGVAATPYPDGRTGVPASFPKDVLASLAELAGDDGAGPLLNRISDKTVIAASATMLLDIDTADDLAKAETALLNRA